MLATGLQVGFGVVIGSLSTYISSGKQEQVKYKQKMDTLHDFFRAKDVPFELRKNVRLFYDNLLRKKTVFDEGEIIASLPPALANDVIYSLYSEPITNTPMFIGLEVEVVAKLCMKLTPFHALSGTIISQEGHQGTEVYIVQKGEVLISRGGSHLADRARLLVRRKVCLRVLARKKSPRVSIFCLYLTCSCLPLEMYVDKLPMTTPNPTCKPVASN